MNNKKALSSFRKITEEFKSFARNRLYNLRNYYYLNNKKCFSSENEIEKLYKFLISSDCDYLIKTHVDGNNKLYLCKKESFKQILFNIRGKKLKPYKSMLKVNESNIRYSSSAYRLQNLQMTKVNFAKSFYISVYGIKEDKTTFYKPFISIKNSPKKKHLKILMPEFV